MVGQLHLIRRLQNGTMDSGSERRWNNGKLEANRRQMLAGIGLVFEIKAGISVLLQI